MRAIVSISYVLLITCLVFAQEYKPYNTFNKEAELQKFEERGGKVEEVSPNVYRLTYRTAESIVFNFSSKENVCEGNNPVDTTIINMWEIDTTKYSNKFTLWQRVTLNNDYVFTPPFVDDLNRNGRPEIYGKHHSSFLGINGGPVEIYERNENGLFAPLYAYPDSATLFVKAMGEIHGSGEKEIFMNYYNDTIPQYVVYRSDSIGVLPNTFDFFFYYETIFQIDNPIFSDFDSNGITDAAFIVGWKKIIISEFSDSINNFTTVFEYENLDEIFYGFAIGDIDGNGKTELITGSGSGKLISIETIKANLYELIWQDNISTFNAYMKTTTKDIDGNGKLEFWIGGQNFVEGITVLQCYQADGANNYNAVARIELRYLTSLSGTENIQAVDIDEDGKEELIINVGNVILILKFVGSPNNHQYKLWYAKLGEETQPGAQFYPAAIADLDGDKKTDLLIPMIKYSPSITYAISYILRQGKPSNVSDEGTHKMYLELVQGYPNPFNSKSTISFNIIETSNVQIKIYDLLGKEINLLLEKELSPGNYVIP